jgi:hypothetical protein
MTQALRKEADAYKASTENRPALRLDDIPPSDLGADPLETRPVYVLRLDGRWVRSRANHIDGPGGPDPRLLRDLPMWLAPLQIHKNDPRSS